MSQTSQEGTAAECELPDAKGQKQNAQLSHSDKISMPEIHSHSILKWFVNPKYHTPPLLHSAP
jgi:hypothetical protein